jgi:hypothetical protein
VRTKLDEIVEEECKGLDAIGKRIAERAFRHGVERGEEFLRLTIQNLLKMDTDVLIRGAERVQPAPAEEKSCFWRVEGVTAQEEALRRCSSFTEIPDRRKGERRKGKETINALRGMGYLDDMRIWRLISISWQRDRRTGKDRRRG